MASLPATFGVAHKFALYGTQDFVTLQSDDIGTKPALDVEVMDETGRVITDRLDDKRIEISLTGVLLASATIPAIGDQIVYNSINGIVKDIADNGVNNNYRRVTIKLVKYQEIA
jgi:hypothetical protein